MQVITDTTSYLLSQWGKWSKTHGLNITYKSFLSVKNARKSVQADISDDLAMMIDSAVARLGRRDPEMRAAIMFYYCCGENLTTVVKELKVNRRRANVLVQAGTAWVDAVIDLAEAA